TPLDSLQLRKPTSVNVKTMPSQQSMPQWGAMKEKHTATTIAFTRLMIAIIKALSMYSFC
ncbi:MAG: hypothetical protein AAFO57_04615, partial [Pseudomonadota bacterium]